MRLILEPTGNEVIQSKNLVIAEAWATKELKSGKRVRDYLRWVDEGYNIMTNEGLNFIRDIVFNINTPTLDGTWFVALFTSNTTPVATATAATPGYTEAAMAGYARQAYTAASNGTGGVSNTASKASFTMPGSGGSWNIYGASVVSVVSGGGASDKLIAYRQFTSPPRVLQNSDILDVTYNFTWA